MTCSVGGASWVTFGADFLSADRPSMRTLKAAGPINAAARRRWRREWDSNPRYGLTYTRFPSVRLKPLGHLSVQTTGAAAKPSIRGEILKQAMPTRAAARRRLAERGGFEPPIPVKV